MVGPRGERLSPGCMIRARGRFKPDRKLKRVAGEDSII